jgi:16S rRNA processing protein RimM
MSTSPPTGYLEVGHVRRAHGLRGDVYVQLLTDRVERIAAGREFWSTAGPLRVVDHRTAAKGRHVVRFDGVADRTAAERLTNLALYAPPLEAGEDLWVHELIGRVVVDQHGTVRGPCVAVVANPAADLLELASGALVPTNFIVGIDDPHDVDGASTIRVDVPEGLFDDPADDAP